MGFLHFGLRIKLHQFLLIFFFLSIFTCSCNRRFSFSPDEREKVTGFFEELLLEHGGAYTLFGTKPITMESLLDLSNENLQKIRDFLEHHPEIETFEIERKFEEGWNIWKRNKQPPQFILKEINLNGNQMLVFMNEEKVIETLLKYYEDFREILGKDFNAEQEVTAFRNRNTLFWQSILLNHKAKGILFGYGYANSSLFGQECTDVDPSENNDPRLKAECTLNHKPFRLPIFAKFDEKESHQLIEKYKKERENIKILYQGRDFLTVTLNRLYTSKTMR